MNAAAFFTSLITWYLIFPSAVLCFAAMKNQVRYDKRKTRILVVSTLLTSSLIVAAVSLKRILVLKLERPLTVRSLLKNRYIVLDYMS